MAKRFGTVILGAAFLMATSAIGPGFLTQTAVFTDQLGASFGFVILISILLDIGAQLNIWTLVSVSGRKAQELANDMLPGLGHLLTAMVVLGGLAFNIGNLAGAGLGLQVITGMPATTGAAISACIGIGLFLFGDTGKAMDLFTKLLGIVMLSLTLYVCFTSSPPVLTAVHRTLIPETIDAKAIITLVGGTVGGYISFAGAHRLLDAGLKGQGALPEVRRSAVSGILLASAMRVLLFLAALGVISQGLELQENNPAASVFQLAAGPLGYKLFGIVMWSAAITSVAGSAYTSYSFMTSLHPGISTKRKWILSVFILLSLIIFLLVGQPVRILVFVGMLNGFILPLALGVLLVAAQVLLPRAGYRHPWYLTLFGVIVILATVYFIVAAILA